MAVRTFARHHWLIGGLAGALCWVVVFTLAMAVGAVPLTVPIVLGAAGTAMVLGFFPGAIWLALRDELGALKVRAASQPTVIRNDGHLVLDFEYDVVDGTWVDSAHSRAA